MIKALNIATPDAEKPVDQLSGGNQQKVVLARSLASQPTILFSTSRRAASTSALMPRSWR